MPFLRAVAILIALLSMLVLLATTGGEPVPVSLQWGTMQLATTAPVAMTFLLIGIVIVFYVGRLIGWFTQIPAMLRAMAKGHKHHTTQENLARAYAALYLGDTKTAAALAKKLTPSKTEETLTALLKLNTGQLTADEAAPYIADPILGPAVTLTFARKFAAEKNWSRVLTYTANGLKVAKNHPALTVLHFKALLNLNDPAAVSFLPQLKSMLTRDTYTLLSTITAAGITTPHAAALSHPWVAAFHKWLPTPSEVLPDEPKTARR